MPFKRLLATLLLPLFLSSNAWAGPDTGSATITPGRATITQGQADEILTELKEIRRLLQGMAQSDGTSLPPLPPRAPARHRTPPKPVTPPPGQAQPQPKRRTPPLTARVSIADRPMLGEPDAPVTMVEFVGYECPYCRRFFQDTYAELKREYIDPGKLRLVVKDLPLGFHRQARQAAGAAHCAGEQGNFWPMHDKLFGGGAGLNLGALLAYGEQLGLNVAALRECLESDRHSAQIEADIAESLAAGIPGTPAFILGRSAGGAVEGAHIRGALPFQVFKAHIDRLLEEPEPR